jgi:hypothetical protein
MPSFVVCFPFCVNQEFRELPPNRQVTLVAFLIQPARRWAPVHIELARKSKASVGFPTEASDVFFAFCCVALARLSAGHRPMEFGELG